MHKRIKAFTLAEVMIVFAVIGILTAILVPVLFASTPDLRTLKAKKSYNTLTRTVENLVNTGPYSINDGILSSTFLSNISGTENITNVRNRYFCTNLTESLNVEYVNCEKDLVNEGMSSSYACSSGAFVTGDATRNTLCLKLKDNKPDYEQLSKDIDTVCGDFFDMAQNNVNPDTAGEDYNKNTEYNFKTSDGVFWGVQLNDFSHTATVTSNGVNIPAFYNVVCFNTDDNVSKDYTFGMGIRNDGKVVVGEKLHNILKRDELSTDD